MRRNIDYILFILLLAFTTFEFFFRSELPKFGLYLFAGLVFMSKKHYRTIAKDHLLFIFIMGWGFLIQLLMIEESKITYFIGRLLTLIGASFIAVLIKDRFGKIFTTTIYLISLISLVFYFTAYIPSVKYFIMLGIAPHFVSLNVDKAVFEGGGTNIIIYNYLTGQTSLEGFMRNSGPFWEPGMFAVFLNLALFFNNFFEKIKIKTCNIFLIISLATTMSAGGYVVGLFLLLLYLFKDKRINVFSLIIGSITILYLYNIFIDLEFIGQKITYQLTNAEIGSDRSRLGALLTQIKMIEASPLIGGESLSKYVVSNSGTLASGTLLPIVILGIPVGLYYYWILYKSSIKLAVSYDKRKINGLFFFLLIVILSFSQTILLSPLMLTIMFIGLLRSKKEKYAQL